MITLEIFNTMGVQRTVYVQTMKQAKTIQQRCFENGDTCAIYEGNV